MTRNTDTLARRALARAGRRARRGFDPRTDGPDARAARAGRSGRCRRARAGAADRAGSRGN